MSNKKNIKKAMVVFAHPDDAEWGCSASIARLIREGSERYFERD